MLMLRRFDANMDFFTAKRKEILTDFQLRLRRVWFAYRHRKAQREMQQQH